MGSAAGWLLLSSICWAKREVLFVLFVGLLGSWSREKITTEVAFKLTFRVSLF